MEWVGEGAQEAGFLVDPDAMSAFLVSFSTIHSNTPVPLVVVDPQFFRPAEVQLLLGDASKAKEKLGWEPKISFEELVHNMVVNDIALLHT
jgi:GDPmannose 4,6-dehydratase